MAEAAVPIRILIRKNKGKLEPLSLITNSKHWKRALSVKNTSVFKIEWNLRLNSTCPILK